MGVRFPGIVICMAVVLAESSGAGEAFVEVAAEGRPVAYAAAQLRSALEARGHAARRSAVRITLALAKGGAESPGPEGYRIRRTRERGGVGIRIEGGDARGVLYGTLALVESIENGTSLADVAETTARARFPFRAIKFNLPWNSYRAGEALALHSETCRDLAYWERFLDMMARNRLNALTLWSLHPFPYMVRLREFPEACALGDEELQDWQAFWQKLFAMAAERGIDTYLVNWNIFVSSGFAEKHGVAGYCKDQMSARYIGSGDTSDLVKRYTRACVTEVLDTYPDLTGLGVSLGERMGGMTADERERWILDTFAEGMKAAGRPARFIHRAPFSAGKGSGGSTSSSTEALTRRAIESLDVPAPVWVEVKFNWSHAHSTPKLVHVHGGKITDTYWNPAPENYRITWMARNEDFFCLRWAEPDFIRRHIELNGHDYVGGYFLGSECYIPAKDYMTRPERERRWDYAFERQWLYYMVWGRLLYNDRTPDETFIAACRRRYGEAGGVLFEALRRVSRMPLRLASFYKGTWDFSLYSEGFLSHSGAKRWSKFISVDTLIKCRNLDPDYMTIKDYVDAVRRKKAIARDKVTPLALADELERDGEWALRAVVGLACERESALWYELVDVRAWAHMSVYFAEKLRGATALHAFRTGGDGEQKRLAVEHLKRAAAAWDELVKVTEPVYAVMPLAHTIKTFHWSLLRDAVRHDIEIAESATPGK